MQPYFEKFKFENEDFKNGLCLEGPISHPLLESFYFESDIILTSSHGIYITKESIKLMDELIAEANELNSACSIGKHPRGSNSDKHNFVGHPHVLLQGLPHQGSNLMLKESC